MPRLQDIAGLGLAALLTACWDGSIGEQREQAAAALDRWATAIACGATAASASQRLRPFC